MDKKNHTYVVAKITTIFVDFKISCTMLYRGTEREIGKFEAVGFAACESTCTAIAEGAGSSVDFAMTTEIVQRSESVNFVDVDTIMYDDKERIVSSLAGRLNYLRC